MWVVFFPTSLCGVLVFDSVSRAPPARLLLPPPPSHNNLTHTHKHTHTNTHNTLTLTHRHTHTTHSHSHTQTTHSHTHKQTTHSHTHKQHTHTHTQTHTFCVASVAQTHIYRHFTWQAWYNLTSTVVLCGRRATYGTGWRAWTWLGARDAAAFCVAGVAQPHIYRHFTWPAWHNLTSTVVLRGRRGTYGTGWRAWTWLGARDAAAFCVAGVAQPHIYRHFTWQAWHNLTSTVVLRGKRGTYGTGWRAWTWLGARDAAALCVAGVVQPHIYRRFVWQACHLWHWVARLDLVRRPWRRGILRGRRGTTSHLPSFHVAGVAQPHIYRRFAWQAWHLWHWVARLDLVRRPWRRGILRGRRGTTSHLPSFHVAGVAQPHIYRRFAWQAWHLWHWVARLDLVRRPWRRGIVRGRRGTNSHLPSFCVAGVALMALGGALGLG